jgi:hypothetical protein
VFFIREEDTLGLFTNELLLRTFGPKNRKEKQGRKCVSCNFKISALRVKVLKSRTKN